MVKKRSGLSSLWQAIAIGVLAFNADTTFALPMLGPNFQTHRSGGLTLVQTGHEEENSALGGAGKKADQQAIVDDDPCHQELNKIFDDKLVEEKPSDVLLGFIENYCVEAADNFLPSKNTNKQKDSWTDCAVCVGKFHYFFICSAILQKPGFSFGQFFSYTHSIIYQIRQKSS